MQRKIARHDTRLSRAHEGAMDQGFHVGERVRTLDGFIGRVLMITESFAPGNNAYQIVLDNGMGGGTYLASQLRPLPEGFGGGHQAPAWLPAGVTARYITEDEAREAYRQAALQAIASDDYPEMGSILHDRPDPGAQIRVIGALQREAVPLPHSQLKLFHMQPDPTRNEPESTRYNPEDPYGHVHWRAEHDPDYEPLECSHCGQDMRDPEDHAEKHSDWLREQDWYTDWNEEQPGDTLHRGIAMRLPKDLHEHVHDESVPVRERAHALMSHVLRDQTKGSPYGGLGNYWSDDQDVSKGYAENTTLDRYHHRGEERSSYQTPVMLHAHFPGMEHVETDPDELEHLGVYSYHLATNREVPIQNQAPMRLKGISWAKPDHGLSKHSWSGVPEHMEDDPAWTHHEFSGEGIRAHAAFYADGLDPREQDYNGEPEVGGVYWGRPAQEQFVDEELGQPEPGPVEMVGPPMPGEEPEEGGEEPEEGPEEGEEDEGEPPPFGATASSASDDDRWFSEYNNAAERLFGKTEGDTLSQEEDEACQREADDRVRDYRQHEASLRDDKSDRWHEYNQQYRPGVIHRGIHVRLPEDLHAYVHDDSQPREDRARALAQHFQHAGLGMHWTPHTQIAHRAIWNAADQKYPPWFEHQEDSDRYWDSQGDPETDVMFHASTGERNRLRTRDELERHQIGWAYSKDEDEFPVKPGSPMRLHGISWKLHEPEYPNEPFEHVDFDKPMRHQANYTPSPDWVYYHGTPDERTWEHGSNRGIHVGSEEAAHQALNARIGRPLVGKWDGTREYGKTLLSPYQRTGTERDLEHARYPSGKATYSTDSSGYAAPVPMDARPNVFPVRITGPMINHPATPVEDDYANARMRGQITRGNARRGYFYRNIGEDEGSISAAVPSAAHLQRLGSVHVKLARVPWTPEERTQLHSWQAHPTATEGDFVNSRDFTNRLPEIVPEPDPETEFAEMVGPRAFTEMTAARRRPPEQDDALDGHPAHSPAADEVYAQLAKKFPPESIAWVHDAEWEGPHRVPLDQIDFSDRDSWEASGNGKKVKKFKKKIKKKEDKGEDPKPAILVAKPGNPLQTISDGHHRALAEEGLEEEDPDREGLHAWTAHVPEDEGPWDQMHSAQETDQGDALDEPGPPGADADADMDADSLEFGDPSATQPMPPMVTTGLPPYSQGGTPGPRTKNYTPVEQSPAFLLAHPELQQHSEPPPGDEDDSDDSDESGDGDDSGKALDSFEAAAGSAAFRFEFTAAWSDVVAKARRILGENGVRITMLARSMTAGEVKGDHATYETGVQYYPGRGFSVMAYSCGCPWATFWQNPDQPGRFAGRMCSHAYALSLAAKEKGVVRRTMFPELGGWPEQVVVKSEPPWHPSDKSWAWQQTAPMTSVPVLSSLIPAGTLDGQVGTVPAVTAARVLVDAGEDPAAVTTLLRLAGMSRLGDQANAPWGSQDVASMPPAKPYGATSPPEHDQDPGSYGFLAGPDPDNWGEIDEGSAIQQPLTNEAARRSEDPNVLDYPDTLDWADDPGQAIAYQDPGDSLQASASAAIFLDNAAPAGEPVAQDGRSRRGMARQGTGPVLDTEGSGASTSPRTMDTNTGPVTHDWGECFPASDQAPAAGLSTSIEPRDPQGLRMEEALAPLVRPHPFRDGGHRGCEDCGRDSGDDVHQGQVVLAELKDEPEPALDPEGLTGAGDGTIGGGDAAVSRPADLSAWAAYDPSQTPPVGGRAQHPDQFTTQNPGMGSLDEPSVPEDPSIQTTGNQQWSGGDYNSGDLASPEHQTERLAEDEDLRDIVAAFQRSAAARQYTGDGAVQADGDIAAAARAYLSKTADVLPPDEADELIREGRGTRARNLDLLDLQGTHYTEDPRLDGAEDDVLYA